MRYRCYILLPLVLDDVSFIILEARCVLSLVVGGFDSSVCVGHNYKTQTLCSYFSRRKHRFSRR